MVAAEQQDGGCQVSTCVQDRCPPIIAKPSQGEVNWSRPVGAGLKCGDFSGLI